MSRINLNVPFHEKDAVKALGARWDPQSKLWYAPDNVDSSRLSKWIPTLEPPNIRASSFFLAESVRDCWRCPSPTPVFGIILPAGHEALQVADDPIDDYWEVADEPTRLSYVNSVANPADMHLTSLAPLYRVDFSKFTQSSYRMNHCERCGSRLGDFETVEEFGSALGPATPEDAAKILLKEISVPLAATCGGYTLGLELFGYMRRSL